MDPIVEADALAPSLDIPLTICPEKPLIRATIFIPLHNHVVWIRELLESIIQQWREDLTLLIVDDASTDGSLAVALEMLQSRPDIPAVVLRNEYPLHHGLAAQIIRYTMSPVLIKADSDDVMLPGRLDAMLAPFEADPSCRLVTSNSMLMSAEGLPMGLLEVQQHDVVVNDPAHWASSHASNLWLGATMAFHRTLLTAFPPLDVKLCPYGLDIILAFRSTLLGTHHYLSRPLVGWRQHRHNTHRVAGALDPQPSARENYAALEGMAMAQRLRDAKHIAATSPEPARFADAVARCADTFFERYENWCRFRTTKTDKATEIVMARVPPVPPIASLSPGRHPFGLAGPLGQIAAEWSGFYWPEETGIWTAAAALLVFRTVPSVDSLTLVFTKPPWQEGQRIFVSVNLGSRVAARISGQGRMTVDVALPNRWSGDLVVLMIEAPEASYVEQDARLLGLKLEMLELSCSTPAI